MVSHTSHSPVTSDTFRFLNVSIDQLWFTVNTARVNGLVQSVTVSVLGTDTQVTIDTPFAGANQKDVIEVRNGTGFATLDMTHLQNLVSVMAGMTPPASAAAVPEAVQGAISANWVALTPT